MVCGSIPFSLGLVVLFKFVLVSVVLANASDAINHGYPCSSPIYCRGAILDAVHSFNIFEDSKQFVDKPLNNRSVDQVVKEFQELSQHTMTEDIIREFLSRNFLPAGSELHEHLPPDWKTVEQGGLPVYHQIRDDGLKKFSVAVHEKWHKLGRSFSSSVFDYPEQHSLVAVPYPFIIPGGRFREIYYWDSLWVIQGLLVSGMDQTARSMIMNFIELIKRFGHIPNGSRVYYRKRSQPPILALAVEAYTKHPNVPAHDKQSLIELVLPFLEKEHDYWMRRHKVVIAKDGKKYLLNVYKGGQSQPRPESYWEDVTNAASFNNSHSKSLFYQNVAAAAESGWDFSSRWLDTATSAFTTIRTQEIVPVDLNAYLCAQETLLGHFNELIGNRNAAMKFREKALDRGDAIEALLWNDSLKMWRDFDLRHDRQREHFYISHVTPLYTRCNSRKTNVTATDFLRKLLASNDIQKVTAYPGGFPASLIAAAPCCQWDFPNAWPPHQLMLIEGFAQNWDVRAEVVPWAQKWMLAVLIGYQTSGYFYEKYDATVAGKYGGGGEYKVQEGFGWTNGGILRLLELFPTDLTSQYRPASLHPAGLHQRFSTSLLLWCLIPLTLPVMLFVFRKAIFTHKCFKLLFRKSTYVKL
ncbi:Treh [Ramazzottius varieornatus]|uniref:Trehalase n=1 Tax=Ramazzottius varieornatus TaxID=947166 RepID=A0A1D1VH27_RAMVA|nr:Treh [Ramazzottius varieornatus]